MAPSVTIGTRGSRLALWQAEWVQKALQTYHPRLRVAIEVIKTTGDKILDVPLAKVGGKGLFVKEIEEALLEGRVDIAVHSMKDMPTRIPEGLAIGAVPERENPLDVWISRRHLPLKELPPGARVGTSSLRRSSQIRALRPDLTIVPLRGNLQTRLRKLADGEVDATVLAAAGMKRMHLWDQVSGVFSPETMLPAVGQGALCVEIRTQDPMVTGIVAPLNHPPTQAVVAAERAFLDRLEGGCQVPIAAHGTLNGEILTLTGLVASLDGQRLYRETASAPFDQAVDLGNRAGESLLSRGAGQILEELKTHVQDDS